MEFISSISFPNEPLISWTFLNHFCHHFWVGFLLLCCCTHPKVMTTMFKKCSTDQRFIRKRNTTCKIHTLVDLCKIIYFFISFSNNVRIQRRSSSIQDCPEGQDCTPDMTRFMILQGAANSVSRLSRPR